MVNFLWILVTGLRLVCLHQSFHNVCLFKSYNSVQDLL